MGLEFYDWVNFYKWHEVRVKVYIFTNGYIVPIVGKKILLNSLDIFAKNPLTLWEWVFFWTLFCLIDLIPIPHCLTTLALYRLKADNVSSTIVFFS